MARRATASKSATVRTVKTKGAERGGGGSTHIPEGDYAMKCVDAKWDESENGNEMIAWVFQGTEGKAKGKKFYFYTVNNENSMWKMIETLEALGIECPEDEDLEVDVKELIGLEGIAAVEDDEYEGKTRSKITRFVPSEGDDEEEEEEEKPAKAAKANGKAKKVVKTSADEVNEMDEDDLETLIGKHELEVDLSDHKILRKKRAAVIAALEENDLLEA